MAPELLKCELQVPAGAGMHQLSVWPVPCKTELHDTGCSQERKSMEVDLVSAALAFARTEAPENRGKTKELGEQFCEQAAIEQDPEKLVQLAKEINRMLKEEENRLKRKREEKSPDQRDE